LANGENEVQKGEHLHIFLIISKNFTFFMKKKDMSSKTRTW